jgi:hypothetical protein
METTRQRRSVAGQPRREGVDVLNSAELKPTERKPIEVTVRPSLELKISQTILNWAKVLITKL